MNPTEWQQIEARRKRVLDRFKQVLARVPVTYPYTVRQRDYTQVANEIELVLTSDAYAQSWDEASSTYKKTAYVTYESELRAQTDALTAALFEVIHDAVNTGPNGGRTSTWRPVKPYAINKLCKDGVLVRESGGYDTNNEAVYMVDFMCRIRGDAKSLYRIVQVETWEDAEREEREAKQ